MSTQLSLRLTFCCSLLKERLARLEKGGEVAIVKTGEKVLYQFLRCHFNYYQVQSLERTSDAL